MPIRRAGCPHPAANAVIPNQGPMSLVWESVSPKKRKRIAAALRASQ